MLDQTYENKNNNPWTIKLILLLHYNQINIKSTLSRTIFGQHDRKVNHKEKKVLRRG